MLVGLALALLLGLPAMNASREAETVGVAELCDDDADAEPVPDGEPEPALALDGAGDAGVLLGVLPDVGAVGEAEVEVEEAEGDGDDDFVGVTVGVGVGVLVTGSTSHLVFVFAAAEVLALADALTLAEVLALTLADVLALGEAASAFTTVPARAAPGQPASTPRVRNPPASRLSTAARTYARRMNIALSTLLIEVTVCSLWDSEATG